MIFESLPIYWVILGLFLVIAELYSPGAFFIWIGAASFLMGLICYIVPLSLIVQALLFLFFSLLSVYGGRFVYKRMYMNSLQKSLLSRRGDQLIGGIHTLESDIVHQKGRLRIGDSLWAIKSSKDLPKGAVIKVIAVEGNHLVVEEEH